MDANDGGGNGSGEQAAHISREMVKLMRRTAGRGPTKARTTIGRDHVLVMFQDTLTEGERNLVDNGMTGQVQEVRAGYQRLIRDEAVELVEATLQRSVTGFMSTNHFDPDVAAEIFVLDPRDAPQSHVPREAEHTELRPA